MHYHTNNLPYSHHMGNKLLFLVYYTVNKHPLQVHVKCVHSQVGGKGGLGMLYICP